ncbi:hypothetical protein [Bacillus solitudinis]|uniref:hypothetical protein n=1 Tax=Bacillus solitudinis TaxID=2014074 RepID=UPI000C23374E|nr:hypothetical protein [Bacillus solitudinis]
MMYQFGNTVRLSSIFYDWDGNVAEPDLVKLKVYNSGYQKKEEFSLGPANRKDDGGYFYDWTPKETGDLIYEWYAELEGNPSLKRDRISIKML